jgi:hypothetical protein
MYFDTKFYGDIKNDRVYPNAHEIDTIKFHVRMNIPDCWPCSGDFGYTGSGSSFASCTAVG